VLLHARKIRFELRYSVVQLIGLVCNIWAVIGFVAWLLLLQAPNPISPKLPRTIKLAFSNFIFLTPSLFSVCAYRNGCAGSAYVVQIKPAATASWAGENVLFGIKILPNLAYKAGNTSSVKAVRNNPPVPLLTAVAGFPTWSTLHYT